ncbi:MAG: A/G-specific adenine glycosylase [Chloroflexi bacterium]|nr:A/G-specific adenine glycosylase [Chloroflexota bacterium]
MTDPLLITRPLLAWWDAERADLPWRNNRTPYTVWVAEIMLQQTQVATVIPYYERWLNRFPTTAALAAASLDDVLKLWEGLGYYSRARNLHAAARQVMAELDGRLPNSVPELMSLPGIGRYTAGAIASIAFNRPAPVLDGNVIRILSRLTDLPDDATKTAGKKKLWKMAADLVPPERPGDFNEALMELGQRVCLPARPNCGVCPLAEQCQARQRGTQLERPVRPPRKRTPHYDVAAGVIWRQPGRAVGAKFLIAQRPLNGLLGGLWEFPGGKQEPGETLPAALKREIQEELRMEIEVGDPLIEIQHAFTHFRITLHAFHAAHAHGAPQHIGVANHAWVTLDDLDNYAFAVTDQKIIIALRKEFASE